MMETASKPVIFSGIQPTGTPTIGNLLGAAMHWGPMAATHDCIYCVVDLHSMTVRQDPQAFRANSMEMFAWLVAMGIDPVRTCLFFQSHVSAHAELNWLLGCYTYMGELSRMTQFKDKSAKNAENINAGLFTYPVLMAADILLYQAALVPIGDDQRQHLELARDIATRFNGIYGDVFTIPQGHYPTVGARIKSLQAPAHKMSKSDDDTWATVFLSDTPKQIAKKFARAVTDSDTKIYMDESKPGISNLINILCAATGQDVADVQKTFDGAGYGTFKKAVADAVIAKVEPYQQEFARLMADEPYLVRLAQDGAHRAAAAAAPTLRRTKEALGLFVDAYSGTPLKTPRRFQGMPEL